MTLQEERAALVKRIEEIGAEARPKPGWYVKWDDESPLFLERIDNIKLYELYCSSWEHVEPFHLVAHMFLPPGWKVVPPETGNLYDWSKAPDWANWAATYENGSVFWYERKPVKEDTVSLTWFKYNGMAAKAEESVKLRPVPWDQSLEQRPEEV